MWLVALNYAPESSRAVRERQMGTERNQDRDRGALGSRDVHIHFREDDVRKPLRTALHPGSIGPGSPALWPCSFPADSPTTTSQGDQKTIPALFTICPFPPLKTHLLPFSPLCLSSATGAFCSF